MLSYTGLTVSITSITLYNYIIRLTSALNFLLTKNKTCSLAIDAYAYTCMGVFRIGYHSFEAEEYFSSELLRTDVCFINDTTGLQLRVPGNRQCKLRPLFGDFMFFISLPFLLPAFFTIINNFLAKFKF